MHFQLDLDHQLLRDEGNQLVTPLLRRVILALATRLRIWQGSLVRA